jgi:UDP-N-acetylglucosamine 2-epimerase (non-hydrolysing)
MLFHLIAAARPNFMKVAPLYHALKREAWADPVIVHTGQHYDLNMSDAFFEDLGLPEPHIHLGVGSGTHAEQTARVMTAYEKVLFESRPDLVIVVGDVNSTMACTIAASKILYPENKLNERSKGSSYDPSAMSHQLSAISSQLGRRPLVAHLESGLRSFDRTMPEEINRIVTDALADILWTPSPDGAENLIREGVSSDKIHRVGNIMIDSLEMLRDKIEKQTVYKEYGLEPGGYALVTLHRPSNVDDLTTLELLCRLLARTADKIPLIFPVHPRTRQRLETNGLRQHLEGQPNLFLCEPLSYVRFMNLVFNCRFALTDSGGIQEETTYMGIPCLTMRPNTERPITVSHGTNQLCDLASVEDSLDVILAGKVGRAGCRIEYWDGHTAERVVRSIKEVFHIDD